MKRIVNRILLGKLVSWTPVARNGLIKRILPPLSNQKYDNIFLPLEVLMDNHRIVYLGTPDISAYVLKGLVDNGFNIVGVVTKEDKVRGRNNKVEESPVAKMAHQLGLPVHKPHRLNKDFEILKEWKPDLLLTFAYIIRR